MACKYAQKWVLPALVLAAIPVATAKQCADAWKECGESQCCSTPYFECVERNKDGAKSPDGKEHKAFAMCRDGNHSGAGWAQKSCPCDPSSNGGQPCEDYSDYKTPTKEKVPWTCVVLTGGCNPAYKPCGVALGWSAGEKKTWQDNKANIPCCQWGCTCKFTDDEVATCQPPKDMYACTKQAQDAGTSDGGDDGDDQADLESDVDAQDAAFLKSLGVTDEFSISKDKQPVVSAPHSRPWAWLLAGGGSMALVTFAALSLRKKRAQRLLYAEASVDAEAVSDSN